jgi:F0F1-type ATP synthase assembly protein I
MVNNIPDDRSPIAVAMHWASQVTTISIEMVLPILLGVWADRRLGTKFVFVIFGAACGLWLGIWSLLRIAKMLSAEDKNSNPRQKNGDQKNREP